MAGNEIVMLPKCENHGAMVLHIPGTPEQRFVGTMYNCPKCGRSVLFPSKELTEFLKEQEARR